MKNSFKRQCYEILEQATHNPQRKIFERFIIFVIILNVLVILIESLPGVYLEYQKLFLIFDTFVVSVFATEYILRVWSITESDEYHHPIWGRLKFMKTPFAIIDLLAIIPFFLPLFTVMNIQFTRISQILRLFRFLKMGRYFRAWEVFLYVFKDKRSEIKMTIYTIAIMILFTSSIMFFIENPAQPEAFSSIPATMWWSVTTLTTVGYGDIVPMTPLGKLFAGLTAIFAIGIFALPAGLLGSGFVDYALRGEKIIICPQCGHGLKDKRKKKAKAWIKKILRVG
ncbi:MAG: ion transporter [Candidatus Altimarinota bacterium]